MADEGRELFILAMDLTNALIASNRNRRLFYKGGDDKVEGFMKKEHFDLFNEVCLEAGIPLKIVKEMHEFIEKDADANGDGKISREEFANFIKSNPKLFTKKILEDLRAVTRVPHPAVDFEETKMGTLEFDKFGNQVGGDDQYGYGY